MSKRGRRGFHECTMKPLFYTQNIDFLFDYHHKIDVDTHIFIYKAVCKVAHGSIEAGSTHDVVYMEREGASMKYVNRKKRKHSDALSVEVIMLPSDLVNLDKNTLLDEVTNMFHRGHSRGDPCCKCCKLWSGRQKKHFPGFDCTLTTCFSEPKTHFSDSDILQEIGCKSMDALVQNESIHSILADNGFEKM